MMQHTRYLDVSPLKPASSKNNEGGDKYAYNFLESSEMLRRNAAVK